MLENNKIGNTGIVAIAKALENNKRIKELYLGNNQVGDDGAQAIARVVEKNSSLLQLQICIL